MRDMGMSRPYSLFLANVVSVGVTGFLVPWVAGYFKWWLEPAGKNLTRTNLAGVAVLLCDLRRHGGGFWLLL